MPSGRREAQRQPRAGADLQGGGGDGGGEADKQVVPVDDLRLAVIKNNCQAVTTLLDQGGCL